MLFLLLTMGLMFAAKQAQSQDSNTDSISLNDSEKGQKRTLHSALLPGWGQWENNQKWKTPVYAGILGSGIALSIIERKNYTSYHEAQLLRLDKDSTTIDALTKFSTAELLRLTRQKQTDLSCISLRNPLFLWDKPT